MGGRETGCNLGRELSIYERSEIEMNKQTILALLLIVIVWIGLAGWVDKAKQAEKKEKAAPSVEATAVSTKEWKTYVSKSGFSVSYPKEWYLDDNSGAGWRIGPEGPAFTIANHDLQYYVEPNEKNIEIYFNTWDDLTNSPTGLDEKLTFFAKNFGMLSVEKLNLLNVGNNLFCLAFGVPRGDSSKYNVLFFYLPKSKMIVSAVFFGTGSFSPKELMGKVLIDIKK
jgi:hypothetical protein